MGCGASGAAKGPPRDFEDLTWSELQASGKLRKERERAAGAAPAAVAASTDAGCAPAATATAPAPDAAMLAAKARAVEAAETLLATLHTAALAVDYGAVATHVRDAQAAASGARYFLPSQPKLQ